MTDKHNTYIEVKESPHEICYINIVDLPNEKWKSKIFIKQRLSESYRATVRTTVTNKSTNNKESESTHKYVLAKRNIISRKITGETYKSRPLPDLQKTTRKHLKKLARKTINMKSEDKELKKHTSNLENQIEKMDFKEEITKVKNQ